MRLHKHAELVEAMARALYERRTPGSWDTASDWTRAAQRDEVSAALDALLEAAVGLEVGRDASLSVSDGNRWTAYQGKHVSYSPALILRLEERTDDA